MRLQENRHGHCLTTGLTLKTRTYKSARPYDTDRIFVRFRCRTDRLISRIILGLTHFLTHTTRNDTSDTSWHR